MSEKDSIFNSKFHKFSSICGLKIKSKSCNNLNEYTDNVSSQKNRSNSFVFSLDSLEDDKILKMGMKKYDSSDSLISICTIESIPEDFDLAVLFLTLMFVEPCKRRRLMKLLRNKCKLGGAIVVFDKLEPISGYPATIFYRLTLAGKKAAGTNPNEIIEKELSLSGVQRPINESQLCGDSHLWFKYGDFAGWLIEKEC